MRNYQTANVKTIQGRIDIEGGTVHADSGEYINRQPTETTFPRRKQTQKQWTRQAFATTVPSCGPE